jgi:hypothetical protein
MDIKGMNTNMICNMYMYMYRYVICITIIDTIIDTIMQTYYTNDAYIYDIPVLGLWKTIDNVDTERKPTPTTPTTPTIIHMGNGAVYTLDSQKVIKCVCVCVCVCVCMCVHPGQPEGTRCML